MSVLNYFFGSFKKVTIFIVIVAIAIPLRYGSTNHQYLRLRLLHSMLSLKYIITSDQGRPNISAEYRAFEDIIRMKPVIKFDPTADIPTAIKEFRSNFAISAFIPKPSRCKVSRERFQHDGHSVDSYWIDYHGHTFEKTSDAILLYLHGGGYMLGDLNSKLCTLCS
jgi:acetyl esterase/lipase